MAFSKVQEMYPLYRVGITLQGDEKYYQSLKQRCDCKEELTPFQFLDTLIKRKFIDPEKNEYKKLINIVKKFSFEPTEEKNFKITGVAILEMLDLN